VKTDSTNTQAPDFGPGFPVYPELPQLVRVSGVALGGTNTYPGFVQQYVPSLTFRDRESCYVVEPNGIVLAMAIYDGRLVGSYLGLPLFAVACCTP
jgi:hypothetical protein